MLRVLTLNIAAITPGWRERRREIVTWLDRLEPDVACFQEVVQDPSGRNTARWLAEAAGGEWHVSFAGTRVADDAPLAPGVVFGNAILSRRSIDREEARPVTAFEGSWARALVLHARTGGLDVFCTHLEAHPGRGALRERQVVELDAFVREVAAVDAPLPPVVCGDFNARPESTEMRFLAGLASIDAQSTYYQDAWRCVGGTAPGHTWDNRNPHAAALNVHDARVDYVYVGDSFGRGESPVPMGVGDGTGRVESARIVCDRSLTGTLASDHYGVLVEVAWPERRAAAAAGRASAGTDPPDRGSTGAA